MINVVNKTIENTIYCPKNLTETEVNFVFDIHSEITNKSFVFEVIDQSSGSSYYKFNVLFDEVPDGEYNWYVLLSGETRSEGLIRIGNWNPASNGTAYHLIQYDAAGYSPIDLQTKQVEINSEGFTTVEPDNGFVGLKEVQVFVDVPNEYEEGFEDGEAAQKAKLIALEVTANGRYEREDGYNQVDVDIDTTPYYESGYTAGYEAGYESGSTEGSEEGYESGYTAGVEAGEAQQKAKLITTAITENGTYAREDGYSSVSVDVPTTVNNQNKTVEYTENGTYIVVPAAGYSGLGSVTIQTNVPHTGHTDAEMEQAYQSGYTSGETVGYESGYTSGETVGYASGKTDGVAEQKAKLVTTAVTENGTYSRADGYSSVTVNVPQTGSTINNQNKTVPITTNGTTAVTFDAGYTGLGTVTINTNVPTGGTINNQDKTVTYPTNGTYTVTADAGYTGLGTVTVNVDTSGSTPESRVAVTLMNQTLIDTAGFNFTYDGGSTAYTFTASTITIGGLLPGKDCVIRYNAVPGYSAPTEVSFRTKYDDTLNYYGLYTSDFINEYFTIQILETESVANAKRIYIYSFDGTMEYNVNNSGWTAMTTGTTGAITDLQVGDLIQFRGDNTKVRGFVYAFISKYKVFGNLGSLLNSTPSVFSNGVTPTVEGPLQNIFNYTNADILVDAENLVLNVKCPTTTKTYNSMFRGCTGLVKGPKSIDVDAIGDYGASYMFSGCTNLTNYPTLNSTSIGREGCREMFVGCTSLTGNVIIPYLSAYGSQGSIFRGMFSGCTSITSTEILYTGDMYYQGNYMFDGCYSLSHIKCMANNSLPTIGAVDWVNGVAADGTFEKPSNVEWPSGPNGIPSGWTVINL